MTSKEFYEAQSEIFYLLCSYSYLMKSSPSNYLLLQFARLFAMPGRKFYISNSKIHLPIKDQPFLLGSPFLHRYLQFHLQFTFSSQWHIMSTMGISSELNFRQTSYLLGKSSKSIGKDSLPSKFLLGFPILKVLEHMILLSPLQLRFIDLQQFLMCDHQIFVYSWDGNDD